MLGDSLLWKIRDDSTLHTSYIFGTIHVYTASYFQIIEKLEQIAENVDTLLTEAPLDISVDQEHYMLPEGRFLESLLTERKFKRVEQILKKAFDFDLIHYNRFLPLLIAQNLAVKAMDAENKPSIDAGIYNLAKKMDKEYSGIESMDEQITILKRIPIDHQIQSLVKISRNVGTFRKTLKRLAHLYESENIRQLYKSSKRELGAMRKLLLFDRNQIIADRIIGLHKEKSSLFSFGAGHLMGKKGVLPILKRQGLTLKPLPILRS